MGAPPGTLFRSGTVIAHVSSAQRLTEQIWRLRRGDRIVICELRHDIGVALGWQVELLEDGEALFSKRTAREDDARFYAESFRQDHVRTGFTE
jgi:hypothetical protein